MTKLLIYPPIESHERMNDVLSRLAWHFDHMSNLLFDVAVSGQCICPTAASVPSGFDDKIQAVLGRFFSRVRFIADIQPQDLSAYDVILKHVEGNDAVDKAVAASKAKVYRVDPVKVRQEGSFYIQCAFDLITDKACYIEESRQKFGIFIDKLDCRKKAWVLATGPSIDGYHNHDFDDALTIVCNSVLLNDEIMQKTQPVAVVFADPIFHFGVSQYAGSFRDILVSRLESTSITVIVPLKYYPLLVSKLPQFRDRIIGVPFEKLTSFNYDLTEDFRVCTTANILTLLLLPLATTLADEVHLAGCDGRPLEQDDYFWGHSAKVQINDKMDNIQIVHPGFFAIDYNEYYFEHCHTLDRFIRAAEHQGKRFCHHGQSHIPALRERTPENLITPATEVQAEINARLGGKADLCLIVEPDGIGLSGHYVKWHRNLVDVLSPLYPRLELLCNSSQQTDLYNCPAHAVFDRHSWSVSRAPASRGKGYQETESHRIFTSNLIQGIRRSLRNGDRVVSLFIYYGSVQILEVVRAARQEFASEGISVIASVCLFHESVIFDSAQRQPHFAHDAAKTLMACSAQVDVYRIFSVTQRLADECLRRFSVETLVLPNPVPNMSDMNVRNYIAESRVAKDGLEGMITVLFPTNPRDEKGADIMRGFIQYLSTRGMPENWQLLVRGTGESFESLPESIRFLGNEVHEDEYWKNLRQASVVVIPYPAPQFSYRTSGILTDTLISYTPCIVISDTWLADIVAECGAGFAVSADDPIRLFSAIKVISSNRSYFDLRMKEGVMAYVQKHSWNNLASMAMGALWQSGGSSVGGNEICPI